MTKRMKGLVIATNQTKAPFPVIPAGAAMVAQGLAERDVEIDFLDLCFSEDPAGQVELALGNKPDFAAISFRNLDNIEIDSPKSYLPFLVSISNLVRQKRIPLYIGGTAAAIAPEAVLKLTGANLIFAGSANAFAQRLVDGNLPDGIVTDHSRESFVPGALDKWVDLDAYFKYEKMIPIRLKRGCPFKCSYCTYPALEGDKAFAQQGAKLENFLRRWTRKNICIDIVDSIFNEPADWAVETLNWIKEKGLSGAYHISAFSPLAPNNELLSAMTEVGATTGMIGVDSGSDEMLASYNKPFRLSHIRKFMEIRKDFDLKFLWTFVIGGPNETEKTIEDTLRFIESLPPGDVAYITLGVRIYPGTLIHGRAIEEGVIGANESVYQPNFYFSDSLDKQAVLSTFAEWGRSVDNAMISGVYSEDLYNEAMQSLINFSSTSPGWRHIPVLIKLMRKMERVAQV